MKPRILLYEDNEMLRQSLAGMLQLSPEMEVVGSFANTVQLEVHLQELCPDIILMDIDMPGRNGVESVKCIRKMSPEVLILMLTVFDDHSNVLKAITAGASGYLLKKHASEKLISAIKDLAAGGAPMSPTIARLILTNLQKNTQETYGLSHRETQVLNFLSNGYSFKMIATELCISIDTIKTHAKNIYSKLQVNSQVEAVSKALKEGLV